MKRFTPFFIILALGLAACAPASVTPSSSSEVGLLKASETPPAEQAETATSEPDQIAPDEPAPASVGSLPNVESAQWTLVVDGLRAPLGLEHAGDERLFILERRGLIWIYSEGRVLEEPFLDVSNKISTQGSEQGLLGLAFHPQYDTNGSFFVNYTDSRGDTVVSRYQVSTNPNLADAQSEKVILQITQPYRNHNGGDLEFGPDGYLYIATGDGGSGGDPEGNAQNLNTLLGKILRINVDAGEPYSVPADNLDQGLGEIWAYGLRNPWRIHFDDTTGDLYIADVGQNQWEEVNFQPAQAQAGWNFGWDLREGAHPYEPGKAENLVDPVAEYSHQQGISVTGGVVVRDPRLSSWQGVYLYGDFGSGIIWGLLRQSNGEWVNAQLWDTEAGISSFGQDNLGQVYLVDYGGRILRLDPAE
ncbi:MAG: PQQ-dependent sugar dehydrogenase [Anaerolineales bacterium]|jgi:glucose/arabinose dehydrogenase